MLLSNKDSWYLPSGFNKELEVTITLGFAAENLVIISCLIFFSRQTDFLIIYGIFNVITHVYLF